MASIPDGKVEEEVSIILMPKERRGHDDCR
jgi:hypothetical protein